MACILYPHNMILLRFLDLLGETYFNYISFMGHLWKHLWDNTKGVYQFSLASKFVYQIAVTCYLYMYILSL